MNDNIVQLFTRHGNPQAGGTITREVLDENGEPRVVTEYFDPKETRTIVVEVNAPAEVETADDTGPEKGWHASRTVRAAFDDYFAQSATGTGAFAMVFERIGTRGLPAVAGARSASLMLTWSFLYHLGDLLVDEDGVSATLLFDRVPVWVSIPWICVRKLQCPLAHREVETVQCAGGMCLDVQITRRGSDGSRELVGRGDYRTVRHFASMMKDDYPRDGAWWV